MPTCKRGPGRVCAAPPGGRITGCSVKLQAGSHKVGGGVRYLFHWMCVCGRVCGGGVGVVNRNLLCSGGVVPHWCLYDVNKSCLTGDSTLRSLPPPCVLSSPLSVSHRGISSKVLHIFHWHIEPQHKAQQKQSRDWVAPATQRSNPYLHLEIMAF